MSTVLLIIKMIALFFGTVVSVLVALQLFYHNVLIQHCSVDPIVHIPWTTTTTNHPNNDTVVEVSTCNVYSDTYNIARQRFRTTVQQLLPDSYNLFSLNIDSMEVKEINTNSKKSDDDNDTSTNTIDIAVINVAAVASNDDHYDYDESNTCNDNKNSANTNNNGMVVHISGTHGIEGYAGSAIQITYLQHLIAMQQQKKSMPFDTSESTSLNCRNNNNNNNTTVTVILIHAFNPYGMKHYRRVNEHNIDLNRNGLLVREQWDQVLNGKHYNTQNYTTIVANQLLTKPTSSSKKNHMFFVRMYILYERYLYSWIRMTIALIRYGIPTIKAALVGGQYHTSNGLFYGGGADVRAGNDTTSATSNITNEPSLIIVRQWLEQFLQERRESKSDNTNPECITWIDVHTGLGPMGIDTLLLGNTDIEPDPNDMQKWFPNSLLSSSATNIATSSTAATANAVQQGYERVVGYTMDYYYSTIFDKNENEHTKNPYNLFFVQEFGTVPSILTGNALVVEHEIYNYLHSSNSRQANGTVNNDLSTKYSKDILGSAFYPQRTEWRINVLQRGMYVLQQSIQRSKYYSNLHDSTKILDNDRESHTGMEDHTKIRPDPSQNVDVARSEL
jgi:hypothetical protein